MTRLDPEVVLHNLGVERPGGWESWNPSRRRAYAEGQEKRARKKQLTQQLVTQRAKSETYRGGHITFVPAADVDPERPRYSIRGIYGPVVGLQQSFILVKPRNRDTGQEVDSIVLRLSDGTPGWGPREFLTKLFSVAAEYGGDCEIYLAHSKMQMQINPEELERWVQYANREPVRALLETGLLEAGK